MTFNANAAAAYAARQIQPVSFDSSGVRAKEFQEALGIIPAENAKIASTFALAGLKGALDRDLLQMELDQKSKEIDQSRKDNRWRQALTLASGFGGGGGSRGGSLQLPQLATLDPMQLMSNYLSLGGQFRSSTRDATSRSGAVTGQIMNLAG